MWLQDESLMSLIKSDCSYVNHLHFNVICTSIHQFLLVFRLQEAGVLSPAFTVLEAEYTLNRLQVHSRTTVTDNHSHFRSHFGNILLHCIILCVWYDKGWNVGQQMRTQKAVFFLFKSAGVLVK